MSLPVTAQNFALKKKKWFAASYAFKNTLYLIRRALPDLSVNQFDKKR